MTPKKRKSAKKYPPEKVFVWGPIKSMGGEKIIQGSEGEGAPGWRKKQKKQTTLSNHNRVRMSPQKERENDRGDANEEEKKQEHRGTTSIRKKRSKKIV